jgi:hypothetical protein
MRKRLGSVRRRSHGTDAKPACGIQDEVRAAPQEHRATRAPEPLHDARHIDEVALLPGIERIEKGPYVLADLGYGFLVEALERSASSTPGCVEVIQPPPRRPGLGRERRLPSI